MRKIFSTLLIVLCMLVFTGCNSGSIDYDLASGGNQVTYTTVMNMEKNPKEYLNKSFKIKGKIRSNGSSYYYMTGTYDSCCVWDIEVRTASDNLELTTTSKNITAIGTYKSSKVNGRTGYYLEISEFV